MKIKDFKETEMKVNKTRKIKKEKEVMFGPKNYYLEKIDDKTWRYHWFKK